MEASLRQLGEGETQDTETKSQTLVYDYDEHARSGSSLTLMTLQGLLLMHSLMHMLFACPLHVSRKSFHNACNLYSLFMHSSFTSYEDLETEIGTVVV